MKTSDPNRPKFKPGATVSFYQASAHFEQGTTVEVLRVRKDKTCASGFRVMVRLNGRAWGWDAWWFNEYHVKRPVRPEEAVKTRSREVRNAAFPIQRNEHWQLMCGGVASTPDWLIRIGDTFKDALGGEIVCSFPETTTRTADAVTSRARLVAAAPDLLAAVEALLPNCLGFMSGDHAGRPHLDAAIAAVAKAKGLK